MLKNVSVIIDYMKWIIVKQRELQQHSIFRIIDIQPDKFDESIVHVQVANKSTIFQCRPSEIVSNDLFLEGFSKQDIRTITYLATRELSKPKQKIMSYRFIDGFKNIVFKIFNKKTAKLEEKTISHIMAHEPISEFSQEDARCIGHMAAMEQSIQEKHFLDNSDQSKGE
jgi:hypothetical protein